MSYLPFCVKAHCQSVHLIIYWVLARVTHICRLYRTMMKQWPKGSNPDCGHCDLLSNQTLYSRSGSLHPVYKWPPAYFNNGRVRWPCEGIASHPRVRFSKVLETFRTRKAVAKSVLLTYSKYEQRSPCRTKRFSRIHLFACRDTD